MRMLVKFLCIATLIGCIPNTHAMIVMTDKDGKPIKPNYEFLARDFFDRTSNRLDSGRLGRAQAQLAAGRLDLDTPGIPADTGANLRSAIPDQTQEETNTQTQHASIERLGPLALQIVTDTSLSLAQRRVLSDEFQNLWTQLDSIPAWNGVALFAMDQMHEPPVDLNNINHLHETQSNEERKES